MITKQVSIVNPTGLHARPANDFVHKAKEFDCRITLRRADLPEARAVNGKSLVSVLALGAACGTVLELTAEGTDEVQAASVLAELLAANTDE